ncbi:MAG: hypothetical protein ACPF8Y_03875 [Flavobacteriales bacterium]
MVLLAFIGLPGDAQAQTFEVTFRVDMSNETVSASGVHLAGNVQGWDPAATIMHDEDMDGVYEVTVDVSESLGPIEYKFINGNAWGSDEVIPAACASNGNRSVDLSETTVLDVVCFGRCAACGVTTVLFQVDMANEPAINPVGVHMNGNFNGWDGSNFIEMEDADGDLIYSYVAQIDGALLDPVDTVQFKFLNGNAWGFDENPDGECSIYGNRFIPLSGADVVYEYSAGQPYCYNQCTGCLEPTPVTFRVDMGTQAQVSPNGVFVAGSFQGWTPGTSELLDPDGDLVYEGTFDLFPGDYEFKFINGDNWGGDGDGNVDNENPPSDCTVNGNRPLVVGSEPVLVEYCYDQCNAECVPDPNPAMVGFRVDMNNQLVSASGVWVMGDFTSPSWQAGAIQMADWDGDGIYEVDVELSGSAYVRYLFCNGDPYPGGSPDDSVWEVGDFVSAGCGVVNPFGVQQRIHQRSGMDEVLPAVCFGACSTSADCVPCSACGCVEGPDFVQQTFECHPPGTPIALSSAHWSTWISGQEGTDMDALVTDVDAASGNHSLNLESTDAGVGGPTDVLLNLGKSEGSWRMSWEMKVLSSAYFNVQGSIPAGADASSWALNCTIDPAGGVAVDGAWGTASGTLSSLEEWFNVTLTVSLDQGQMKLDLSDDLTTGWVSFSGDVWGSVNFFAFGDGVSNGHYLVDDIVLDPVATFGCLDEAAANYDPDALFDLGGDCIYIGCTDPAADNYDPTADVDDGSCSYFTPDCEAIGAEEWAELDLSVHPVQVEMVFGVDAGSEWVLNVPPTLVEPASGSTFAVLEATPVSAEGLPEGIDLMLPSSPFDGGSQACMAVNGVPLETGLFEVEYTCDVVLSLFGQPFPVGDVLFTQTVVVAPNPNPIPGCTYSGAANYVPFATVDDGGCVISGCMDAEADNYHPIFNEDDGSCLYGGGGGSGNACPADVNNDALIGVADLLILLGEFGLTCTP